jgi:hypothetical protein
MLKLGNNARIRHVNGRHMPAVPAIRRVGVSTEHVNVHVLPSEEVPLGAVINLPREVRSPRLDYWIGP